MHFTREQIWQTALAELQEQKKKITPQSLTEAAARIASDLINEIIYYRCQRLYARHGLKLLQVEHLVITELQGINPLAWYYHQTSWRQCEIHSHAQLIAEQLTVLLWNRQLARGCHQQYFNFTAQEATAYCPAQQLSLL